MINKNLANILKSSGYNFSTKISCNEDGIYTITATVKFPQFDNKEISATSCDSSYDKCMNNIFKDIESQYDKLIAANREEKNNKSYTVNDALSEQIYKLTEQVNYFKAENKILKEENARLKNKNQKHKATVSVSEDAYQKLLNAILNN